MRKLQLALIVFAALITLAPHSAQSQTTDCGTQQRREIVLTVVDRNDAIIDRLRRGHFALKVGDAGAKISDVEFHFNKQPLDIVLLIDASVSQEKVLSLVSPSPPKKLSGPGSTSLWDVIQSTGQKLFGANTENRRRVMLVFSDAIAKQLRANYVIGYCGDVNGQGKLRVEITQPDIRSIKPVLAYKRFEISE